MIIDLIACAVFFCLGFYAGGKRARNQIRERWISSLERMFGMTAKPEQEDRE